VIGSTDCASVRQVSQEHHWWSAAPTVPHLIFDQETTLTPWWYQVSTSWGGRGTA